MGNEPHPVPARVVMSAGTGGSSATIGRYIRYRQLATKLCVADVEHSVFDDAYMSGDMGITCAQTSRIEGIGRPRVEPSAFMPDVIDQMIKIPDAADMRMAAAIFQEAITTTSGCNGRISSLAPYEQRADAFPRNWRVLCRC